MDDAQKSTANQIASRELKYGYVVEAQELKTFLEKVPDNAEITIMVNPADRPGSLTQTIITARWVVKD